MKIKTKVSQNLDVLQNSLIKLTVKASSEKTWLLLWVSIFNFNPGGKPNDAQARKKYSSLVVWHAGLTCSLISRAPGVKQFLLTSFLYTLFVLSNQTLKTTIINAQCKIYINMWCYSPWGSWNKAAGEPCISYYNAFHTTICREPQQPCFMTNFFITFLYTLFYCLFKNNHFGDFEQVIVKIVVLPILNKS